MNKLGKIASIIGKDLVGIIDLFVFALFDMFVELWKNAYKVFIILACWKYCFGF